MNTISSRPSTSPAERAFAPAAARDLFASFELTALGGRDGLPGFVQALVAKGLKPLEVLLGADRKTVLCRWPDVDASALRDTLRTFGLDVGVLWSGVVLELSEEVTANVVVEDNRDTPIRSIFPYDRIGTCLINHRVTPVRVAVSLDGCHLLAFYRAPDAESVRLAQRHGSVCAGRVWTFETFRP